MNDVRLLHETGDAFVLRCDSAGKIDNQHTQVRAPNAPLRSHDAEYLHRTGMLAASAHPSRVDEGEILSVALVRNIDGVARCARQFAYNRAVAAENRIDKGRFADIRTTHDRERGRLFASSRAGT